jgi:IclR family acetate operon transcriptional repressor
MKKYLKNKSENETFHTSLTPAVEQAAEVLKYLASDRGIRAGLTDISRMVGINKSKTYAILNALQNAGFVSKDDENKLYFLGPDIIPIGQKALENLDYREAAKPFLKKLARDTKCTALFAIITTHNLVFIAKEESGSEVDSRLGIGYSTTVFYRAHGKAILAALPEEELNKLLSGENFFRDDERGFLDNASLKQELREVKKRGFDMDNGRVNPIIKVLSAAVLGHNNHPIGVLVLIGLMAKSQLLKNAAMLVEMAKQISNVLGAGKREY